MDYYNKGIRKILKFEKKVGDNVSAFIYILTTGFWMISYNSIIKSNNSKFSLNQINYQISLGQTIVFYLIIAVKEEKISYKWNEDLLAQSIRNFFFYFFRICSFYSVSHAPIYTYFVVLSSTSIIVPILDSIFFSTEFGRFEVIGSIGSIFGTLIIYYSKEKGMEHKLNSSGSPTYIVFFVMAVGTFFYSAGIVISRKFKNKPTMHTCIHSSVMSVIASTIAMIFLETLTPLDPWEIFKNYVAAGFFISMSVLFFIRANILGNPIDIAIIGIMSNLFWSMFEEYIFFGEYPKKLEILGMVVTIVNVIIYSKLNSQRRNVENALEKGPKFELNIS